MPKIGEMKWLRMIMEGQLGNKMEFAGGNHISEPPFARHGFTHHGSAVAKIH